MVVEGFVEGLVVVGIVGTAVVVVGIVVVVGTVVVRVQILWELDRLLFAVGQQNKICVASNPKCPRCYLRTACAYYARTQTEHHV